MEDRYLFKAKHFEKWHIGNIVKEPDGLYIRDKKKNVMAYIDDESTICQCTGLKDKNGKLIWENDIMVAHLDDNYPEDKTYIRILWRGNGFYSIENGSIDTILIDKFDQDHFEVIGNIFDNAELLESEEK
jgi:uncharacterized phage protein (TIGR01671 family)